MTKLELEQAIKKICVIRKVDFEDQAGCRKIEIFNHKSYGEESYQVWFFAIEGSPIRMCGFAKREYSFLNKNIWHITTEHAGNIKRFSWYKGEIFHGKKLDFELERMYINRIK